MTVIHMYGKYATATKLIKNVFSSFAARSKKKKKKDVQHANTPGMKKKYIFTLRLYMFHFNWALLARLKGKSDFQIFLFSQMQDWPTLWTHFEEGVGVKFMLSDTVFVAYCAKT